nr:Transposon Ty3-G Gag-Pol polyprotein [Ipomoea batatas]GME15449.1 Transposon Ty3-G Gag-Pol polyprotein [Ipomoea batatas]GME19231.1 Transposon Ty3-G Gag-Pol polyprotein [Ipomoea batatas]
MAETSDAPITMQNLKQMLDGLMINQEARLQSQWKDQFQSYMASMEAKWQTTIGKAKGVQQSEVEVPTPNSSGQALFRATSAAGQAMDGEYSEGTTGVTKHHSMRLDIPKFGGEDPHQWIFNIQEYLQIAGFCLEAEASEWFRWMKRNRMIFGWHDFLEKVAQRFGTTHFEDPLAELAKLTQTGTVADFQAAFEKLLNRVTGVTETQLVSYVLGGLKPHVRRELLLARPRTVLAAFELAKAHEARNNELMSECRTAYRGSPRVPSTHEDTRWQSRGTNFSQVTMRSVPTSQPATTTLGGSGVPKFLPAPTAQATSGLPIRKYTSAEIWERRDKGLCFHCDKKYSVGHRCKGRFLVLIGDDEDEAIEVEPIAADGVFDEEVISGDVSMLNTMSGPGSPRSLRLVGKIKSSPCVVLIDSGSTHNFITPAIVEKLQLPTKAIKPFKVYIGNGDTLGCQLVCPSVEICMQGFTFTVDLQVLRIVGPDVVLGVQWLQSLGSVTHDYSEMIMTFQVGSKKVTIKGESCLNSQPVSFNQLQAMATHAPFDNLLLEFSSIFEPPDSLPPHRNFDHRIHLLPNSKPVNVRPYRYPYF